MKTFGELAIGSRFRVAYLSNPMIKIHQRHSMREHGSKPFVGAYNSVALGGGRWIFDADRKVIE